ncbi:AFR696Cp [Eremothecium gossypii ATCC 10895]|uniref:non-specific serine/threonine protein kinase n=1 Tax=Eremothecium gossypii (strain ATCC 10895 / CBS 109.51 / FGSC 9923 / NRRL Y-1056) TaxID=284811 RepID=Q751X9_EREGS|nr:AFR696Cp [Eremothecium gossypii ATCC 10895]AAS54068.1 AFR696Cp [Eremothecium gossypii ATCC 10895]AEY98383.1 FAFR696Cp [Eremothecium gossypii FDAG1]
MGDKNNNVTSLRGDRIGPWKLGETLGAGSTGKVLLAQNTETGQIAAVKVISKSVFNAQGSTFVGSNDPDVLPYGIEREIIIMKLLNHPNVLRLYDVWETAQDLYMVLEYVEKGELFNLLVQRGPLPENEAVRFFRQIIIGISYCHALGIVHRDLKPENLLLDHKFNIKLADFGMAALESKDKLLETSCGSPHYAAPEIVSGLPYHGFESDVWSCGVILYALLTGRLPFDEEDGNIRNLLLKVQSGKYEIPGEDEISPEARDLIVQILTVEPEQRIKTREILKHPLLQKYPSIKDSKSIRNLPREDTYLNPLDHNDGTIDQAILQNLVVLWHGRDKNEITMKLKEPGANLEKTFYALLHRFKFENEQQQLKQQQIAKRISSTSSSPQQNIVKSSSRRSINNILSTPKKKRSSAINVSSAHKRPVSIQKLNDCGTLNPTSPSKKRSLSNRKLSAVLAGSNSSSPSRKRMSVGQDAPPVPTAVLRDYNKRASRASKRLSFLPSKRGSITTKIIATYAKLSEDNDWEYIDREAKRTSSDFATLIDNIFEHEKYEQIRREKEELERKVREAKEREERERRARAEAERRKREEEERRRRREVEELIRQRELQKSLEEQVARLKAEVAATKQEKRISLAQEQHVRSISEPMERKGTRPSKRDSFLALQNNINSLLKRRTLSLETRPISRLDPGIRLSEENTILEDDLECNEDRLRVEKNILETIRRSKFLGSQYDIDKELQRVRREKLEKVNMRKSQDRKLEPGLHSRQEQRFVSDGTTVTSSHEDSESIILPKNVTAIGVLKDEESEPRKLSEVKIPQFTRRSKHFSASSKRLSVLSMYSTKVSYTNLADYLNNDVQLKSLQPSAPTSIKIPQEPEFMFESAGQENRYQAAAPTDTYLERPKVGVEGDHEPGEPVELIELDDSEDRSKQYSEEDIAKVKLPILPPLDHLNKPNGLGIYQAPAPPKEPLGQPVMKSMIPDDIKIKCVPNQLSPRRRATERAPEKKLTKTVPERVIAAETFPPPNTKKKPSFFKKFSREKMHSDCDVQLDTTVGDSKMFRALNKLLNGWTSYGLKEVRSMPASYTITGKLSSDNILSLRSTAFEIVILSVADTGSSVKFTKKSGSKKTFTRLVNEIEKILEKESVLVLAS